MATVECSQARVRSIVTATIEAPLARAWSVAGDFYNLAEWVPRVAKCYKVRSGVRYVQTLPDASGKVSWVEEKLVSFSNAKHSVSYVILAGNMGLNGYKATLKLSSVKDGKTLVTWSFEMDASSPTPKNQQEDVLRRGIQSLAMAAKKRRP